MIEMNRLAENLHDKTISILPSQRKVNQLIFQTSLIGNIFWKESSWRMGRFLQISGGGRHHPMFATYSTKFGFLFRLCRPSMKRTVPDFARITTEWVEA